MAVTIEEILARLGVTPIQDPSFPTLPAESTPPEDIGLLQDILSGTQETSADILSQREGIEPRKIGARGKVFGGLADALRAYASINTGRGFPRGPGAIDQLRARRQAEADRRRQDLLLRAGQAEKTERRDAAETQKEIDRQRGLEKEERDFQRNRTLITEKNEAPVRQEAEALGIETGDRPFADINRDVRKLQTIEGLMDGIMRLGEMPKETGAIGDLREQFAGLKREEIDSKGEKLSKIGVTDMNVLRDTLNAIAEDADILEEALETGKTTPNGAMNKILLGIDSAFPAEEQAPLRRKAIQRYQRLILPIIDKFNRKKQEEFTKDQVPEIFAGEPPPPATDADPAVLLQSILSGGLGGPGFGGKTKF